MKLEKMPLLVWMYLVIGDMLLIKIEPMTALQIMLLLHRYMDVQFFAAFFVLETDLVVVGCGAAHTRSGLEATPRFVAGQTVRRHGLGIPDTADDDRLIGIAFHESDQDFLPDSRDLDESPLLAGPAGADSKPTGTVGILFALAIPVELHFHPTVFVRENFFSRTADNGVLDTVDKRPQVYRGSVRGWNGMQVKVFE
jgi:hypothetical protein